MNNNKISIVTMFFDIGRGDWSKQKGIADFANRDNDKYFAYFAHLAKLKNDMVVFTTPNFNERIRQLREDRPTTIINIDLESKFGDCIRKIEDIQNSENFVKHIPESLRQNPEYRSPKYVLVTNLKVYFVNRAIKEKLVRHNQVAWVDFGYCRNLSTLQNIAEWHYNFSSNRMNFFTIRRDKYWYIINRPKFPRTIEATKQAIFNNVPYLIGGVIVGTQKNWLGFGNIVREIQTILLHDNIVDDDQGIFLMCHTLYPKLIKLNYIGAQNWFGVFEKFHS